MKILHLIDTFDSGDNARQLQILGPALRNDASIEICCLGPETPRLAALRQSGIAAHALNWARWFDPSVFMSLRALLRESAPDVIHVWGLQALRTLTLCGADYLPRVVASGEYGKLAWWDRRLLQHVCRTGDVPPALDTRKRKRCQDPFSKKGPDTFFRIVCVEPSYRHAIWTFDFVRLLFPDATLHVVVAAPERATLVNMTYGLECTASVFFHDAAVQHDVVEDATVVWIPSLTNRGQQAALEAMALGRPVIASDVPCLRSHRRRRHRPPDRAGDVVNNRRSRVLSRRRARSYRGGRARCDACFRLTAGRTLKFTAASPPESHIA